MKRWLVAASGAAGAMGISAKFLEDGALRIITAYGDGLAGLRVDRASVHEQLGQESLVRFLKPDWRGKADLVLTTYETLRDFVFSFARET